ncbi:hypothetical protein NNU63_004799 [Klebsiella pneumoniae]|nr:hypothetical protein [Klebsiella pneumoniae]HBR3427195.1 hypothetical protein [Klebsiella pneumoniae]HBV4574969.1 hypothetical protein [Klebsiella pneumoniae]
MKKKEEPITTFIWCGAVVKVYVQVVKFAGTTIQRHLLPRNLRNAVNSAVQDAENIPHSDPTNNKSPRRVSNVRPSDHNNEPSITARGKQVRQYRKG